MTDPKEELQKSLKWTYKFCDTGIGATSGHTTGKEKAFLELKLSTAKLLNKLEHDNAEEDSIDDFKAKFVTAQLLSSQLMSSFKASTISQEEAEKILDVVEDYRETLIKED